MDGESPILRDRWRNLKTIVKRALVYSFIWGVVGFFNYFGLPIAYGLNSNSIKKHIKDKKIQQVCRTDSWLEDIVASIDTKNCGVLPFVKAAHALSAKHLSYELPPLLYQVFHSKEKKMALEGEADCSYFSIFTYSNFLYLAEKWGRPELKN